MEVSRRFSNLSHWFKLPLRPLLPTIAVRVFYLTPPNPLDGLTWNFVGWYIEVQERFSYRSHWFKLPLPPDLLLPTFAVSVFYQTPPDPLDGLTWNFVGWYIEVLGRFSNWSHWFKLPLPPDLLLPTFAVSVFYQTPPNPLDGLTWNFVGWYIEVLGRFSNWSHWFKLPLPPVRTGIVGPIVHFS